MASLMWMLLPRELVLAWFTGLLQRKSRKPHRGFTESAQRMHRQAGWHAYCTVNTHTSIHTHTYILFSKWFMMERCMSGWGIEVKKKNRNSSSASVDLMIVSFLAMLQQVQTDVYPVSGAEQARQLSVTPPTYSLCFSPSFPTTLEGTSSL